MVRWLAAGIVLAAFAAGLPDARVDAGALPTGYARIAFAGDTHGYNIVNDPDLQDEDLLGGVRTVLGKADLFVFNHEGTLIDEEDIAANCMSFANQSTLSTPPVFAERLDPGVPAIAALGNNHAMDCGAAGLQRTIEAFDEAGIAHLGAGMTLEEACAPLLMDVNGVELAFVSYLDQDPATLIPTSPVTETSPGVATMDACGAQQTIEALSQERTLIVMLHAHWGSSWVYGVSQQHVAIVNALLSWGADLVVSSGPHLLQGVMRDGPKGSLALMGVGNFMFRPYFLPAAARRSVLPLVEIDAGEIARAWLYPVAVSTDGIPSLAQDSADDILQVIDSLSAQLDSAIIRLKRVGLVFPSRGAP
jgi:poly-gamma-glutamate synthesis protein (capsule biosynthesis protein)